jgi:hypothetical protein
LPNFCGTLVLTGKAGEEEKETEMNSKDLAIQIQAKREELESVLIAKRQLEDEIMALTNAKIYADNN